MKKESMKEQKPSNMRPKGYMKGGKVSKMGIKPQKQEKSYKGYGAARKG